MASVLLIENNVDQQEICSAVLESRGHTVHVASDGLAGLQAARSLRPDVVLLNIGLPVLSGLDVAVLLKAHPDTEDTPVIAVTAYAREDLVEWSPHTALDGYLRKPVTPARVVEVVEQFVDRVIAGAG